MSCIYSTYAWLGLAWLSSTGSLTMWDQSDIILVRSSCLTLWPGPSLSCREKTPRWLVAITGSHKDRKSLFMPCNHICIIYKKLKFDMPATDWLTDGKIDSAGTQWPCVRDISSTWMAWLAQFSDRYYPPKKNSPVCIHRLLACLAACLPTNFPTVTSPEKIRLPTCSWQAGWFVWRYATPPCHMLPSSISFHRRIHP